MGGRPKPADGDGVSLPLAFVQPKFFAVTGRFALAGGVVAIMLYGVLWAGIWLHAPGKYQVLAEYITLSFWPTSIMMLNDRCPGLEGIIDVLILIIINILLYFILGRNILVWIGKEQALFSGPDLIDRCPFVVGLA
jgi:hypothetical protein